MMATDVPQSIHQSTTDQFQKQIKEHSGNKPALLKTIVEILENQSLNTFSEFLHLKEIDEVSWCATAGDVSVVMTRVYSSFQLKTGEFEKYYHTMNLFAFGTYRQYLENKDKIIELTPVMDKKLKHLTILTLANQKKTLPYDELMVELDLKNVRHLEDLIIEAIYSELINGKLDQKNRQLEVDYAVARDIQTENIAEIVTILTEWLKSCESCSSCLQEQIENANAEKTKRNKHKEQLQEKVRTGTIVFLYE